MIDLYSWATPNGKKISIMLEEVQLPYKTILVDISQQEQFKPAFLKISPNSKIPAIVDHEGPGGGAAPARCSQHINMAYLSFLKH